MKDCVFCKVVEGKLPSDKVYEDDKFLVIKDLHPTAPTHLLIIPKTHIDSVNEINEDQAKWLGEVFTVAKKVAKIMKIDQGYKLGINVGEKSGQVVFHLHVHLMGGWGEKQKK